MRDVCSTARRGTQLFEKIGCYEPQSAALTHAAYAVATGDPAVARTPSLPFLAGLVGLLCLSATGVDAKPRGAAPDRALKAVDSDADGTIDLREAQAAGSALFDRLDGDKDGSLTIRELQGRLSRSDFKSADPDNDRTLTRQEFLTILASRFKAADPDKDGTLDQSELTTPAGAALLRLLK
jgi:hypothetical protein